MAANTTASRKAKGRRLQQHIRDRLRSHFALEGPVKARYSSQGIAWMPLESGDIECTLMGESGRDIKLSPLADKYIPFDFETKNTETASPWTWMKQAKENTKPGRKPAVIFTRNREGDVYAMIRFEDLLELL